MDTGETTLTGGRLEARQRTSSTGPRAFCLTYGDGVSDVDISALIAFHRAHGRSATVTAVVPPGRYRRCWRSTGDSVTRFIEKPPGDNAWINGGFFVLEPAVLD